MDSKIVMKNNLKNLIQQKKNKSYPMTPFRVCETRISLDKLPHLKKEEYLQGELCGVVSGGMVCRNAYKHYVGL